MQIKNVVEMEQRGYKLFVFTLSGDKLLEIARIEQFGIDKEGVNRKFDYLHSKGLTEYMTQTGAHLFEPFLGDLTQDWQWTKGKGILFSKNGSYLSIDDGQHRVAALKLLSADEIVKWNFLVVATKDLPYKERLKIFNQQRLRKKIDPRLSLQIQDITDTFPDQVTKDAYKLIKRLNQDKESPLYQRFFIQERDPRGKIPVRAMIKVKEIIPGLQKFQSGKTAAERLRQPKAYLVNVVGLMNFVKVAISSRYSPVQSINSEMQYRVIKDYLQAAKEAWPKAWDNPRECLLCRYHGLAALLNFLTYGIFKEEIKSWQKDSYKKLLAYAIDFDWSYSQFKDQRMPSPKEIQDNLNIQIARALQEKKRKGTGS